MAKSLALFQQIKLFSPQDLNHEIFLVHARGELDDLGRHFEERFVEAAELRERLGEMLMERDVVWREAEGFAEGFFGLGEVVVAFGHEEADANPGVGAG